MKARLLLSTLAFLICAAVVANANAQSTAGSTLTSTTSSGSGWGKGGKPKPSPTPSVTPAPTPVDGISNWTGTTNSDFNTATNWTAGSPVGGTPPVAGDVAWFSASPTNKTVNLSASVSIAGLYFTGTSTSGYDITSTGGAIFTLTGTATNTSGTEASNAGAAMIGADNTSGTNTIDASFTTGAASGSQTIYQAAGGTLVINGVISGARPINVNGGGTIVFAGTNTYTGGTNLNAGVLRLGTGIQALGGTGTVASVGTIAFNGGTLQFTSSNTTDYSSRFSNTAGQAFNIDTNGQNVTFASQIISTAGGAAGTLTKLGAGTLTLTSGVSRYTGATTIDGGTLTASTIADGGTDSSIGRSTNAATNLVFGGGTLQHTAANVAGTDRLFTIGDSSGLAATLDSSAASSTNTLSFTNTGSIAFGGSGARTLTLTGTNTGNNTFAPILGDGPGGATSLLKTGSGTWVLTGANTYTGGTQISGGTLTVNTGGTLGASTAPLTMSVSGSQTAVLNLNVDQTVGSLSGSVSGQASATINIASGKTLTSNQSVSTSYGGVIAGAGRLTKDGAGRLTLSGTNTYTGATKIDAGILNAGTLADGGSASGIGQSTNAAANLVFGGGTLQYTGSTAASTDRLFTIGDANGSSATIDASGGSVGTLSFTNGGSIVYGTTGTHSLTLTGTNVGNNAFSLAIGDGTGATSVSKTGGGTWVLSGNNSYTGGTTLSNGLLETSSVNALGSTSGQLTVNGGVLDFVGTSISVGNLTGTGGIIRNNLGPSNTVTFTIGTGNTGGGNYQGVIADNNGANSGKVALTKTGTGTITLSGTNTYTGATSVNGGGSLFINGNQSAATGTVTVTGSGTTLGGSGMIGGAVSINAGSTSNNNLSPGATGVGSVAKLGTGSLTLTNNTNLNIDITGAGGTANAGTNYDQVSVTGTVTLGSLPNFSNLVLSVSGLTQSNVGQAFFILANDSTDAISGVFAQGTTITSGSDVFTIDYTADFASGALVGGNDVALVLTAVPEPSTWVAAALAAALLGYSQRKRFRQLVARA